MKRFLSGLIGVGTVALIFPLFSGGRAARTPESYPLVCRGSLKTDPGPVFWPGCPPTDICKDKYAGFTFIRGSKPARDGLAPGECSWVDRGMRADEPNRLVQKLGVGGENYDWLTELHSPDSYWTFNVYSLYGILLVTGAERNGTTVVSDKRSFPAGSMEVKSPDFYIAEVKIIDLPPPLVGTSRLAVRVGNKGTGDAGEVVLDLRRMRVCKDHQIPRSYRQMAVPALRSGQEQWIYLDGFDREWGSYITREGKNASRLELAINPSDLYPDCTNVMPVTNYVKTEKETANNSLLFDPKAP